MTEPELTYQGRRLPRPQDEVVDQGLGFDIGTLFSRRRALRVLGLGAAGVALTACGADTGGSTSTTTSTTGSSSSVRDREPELPARRADRRFRRPREVHKHLPRLL